MVDKRVTFSLPLLVLGRFRLLWPLPILTDPSLDCASLLLSALPLMRLDELSLLMPCVTDVREIALLLFFDCYWFSIVV